MRYLLTCLSCCLLYSAGAQYNADRNHYPTFTSADLPALTRMRIEALEKTVDSLRWKVRYTEWMADQAYQHLTMPMRLNEDDSIRISKIVWWKVMSMFYPGDGMYVAAGDKISYGWMYTWLPRRLKCRFEKAMRLGKYQRQ